MLGVPLWRRTKCCNVKNVGVCGVRCTVNVEVLEMLSCDKGPECAVLGVRLMWTCSKCCYVKNAGVCSVRGLVNVEVFEMLSCEKGQRIWC